MVYDSDTIDDAWVETSEIELRDEIECAIEHVKSQMSDAVKSDISRCNADLYYGPLYFNAEGEECSCFDEGARQFDFCAARDRVSDWADSVEDLRVEVAFNTETGESLYERVDSACAIVREIVGKELAALL